MPALILRINVARIGEAAAPALPWLDEEIALQLSYLDGALRGRPYVLGSELSAADIQLSFIGELAAARLAAKRAQDLGLAPPIAPAIPDDAT